jgi:hypothetical protein
MISKSFVLFFPPKILADNHVQVIISDRASFYHASQNYRNLGRFADLDLE